MMRTVYALPKIPKGKARASLTDAEEKNLKLAMMMEFEDLK